MLHYHEEEEGLSMLHKTGVIMHLLCFEMLRALEIGVLFLNLCILLQSVLPTCAVSFKNRCAVSFKNR